MAQAVFHNYTDCYARYELTIRKTDIDFSKHIDFIKHQIGLMENLKFRSHELTTMNKRLPFLKNDFFQYLNNSFLNTDFIDVSASQKDGGINIVIEGPWLDTIWFEIPILSILSELNSRIQLENVFGVNFHEIKNEAKNILKNKIEKACDKYNLDKFPDFADFGTRRRASADLHRYILEFLKNSKYDCCIGTSNVMLGIDLNMKMIGTMAHEWIMAHAGFTRFDLSQKMALDVWQKEYRDQLGVALTDTYTTDFFLKDFDALLAKSFSGIRQDSGDPKETGYKFIRHYESLGIDPSTKTIIFSDGLDFDKMAELYNEFNGKIKVGFGIGTNLTSDLRNYMKPLNAVIKMTHIKRGNEVWWPLIKISDSPGKTICNDEKYKEFIMGLVNNRI